MCGITGLIDEDKVEYRTLFEMVQSIKHRGPDDTGFFLDGNVGLGHSRLSIIDPQNGTQPIENENNSIVVIFNGEIYNHMSLRKDLAVKGHTLANNSDTAILPHMYEEYGTAMFQKLNGQFAIAIWVKPERKLVLARDRLGEKPLYYYYKGKTFCFASEAKAIFTSKVTTPRLSPVALKQVFTYWTTLSTRSIFEDIYQVPPGNYLVLENSKIRIQPYWKLTYSKSDYRKFKSINDFSDELDDRLRKSIKSRMMSDVPISFYLSGGLDSSLITSMASEISNNKLNTFSITFEDINFDESVYQEYMSKHLGTNHQNIKFSVNEFPSIIKEVTYFTEMPLLRSGAFPMYVLAKLVRSNNIKVVLSGEGSDELFGGYDIFREVKIREFCNRSPDSKIRTALYKKVNNFVKGLGNQPVNSLSMFYNNPATESLCSSHYSRWKLGQYSEQFFSPEYCKQMECFDELECIEEELPVNFRDWTPVQRAQYLEVKIFFSNYLLSSQGDRVSMATSVECRYPFLDYDIIEFANSLPDNLKIKALNEKYIVKKLAQKYVPDFIVNRKKFPYRAPINIRELMKDGYLKQIVSTGKLMQYGIFNPESTGKFLSAITLKETPNERDCMLFMGILTTQILYDRFIASGSFS